MQPLRVNVDDLRLVAGRLEALARRLVSVSASSAVGSSWLASSAAVLKARTDAATAQAALAARMQATSRKLAEAGAAYADSDARLGARVRELAGLEAK